MSLAVRPASEADRQKLIEILERNIDGEQARHFGWRHETNPAGSGWSWVIYEKATDAIFAMASVFPRYVYVSGKEMRCGLVGEFVVDSTHRSLGPAVGLQRATFQPAQSGAVAFCYDAVPHDRGMSTFMRLGLRPCCELVRFALPLRSDEFLEKRLGAARWTKAIAGTANLMLKIKSTRRSPGIEITELNGKFGADFSELDSAVPLGSGIRGRRSACDLNYHFRSNPDTKYRVLVASKAGELMGFLSFMTFEKIFCIADLFGKRISETAADLLSALIDLGRREKMALLEGFSTSSSLATAFVKTGFRQRETAVRIVPYGCEDSRLSTYLQHGAHWELTRCNTML